MMQALRVHPELKQHTSIKEVFTLFLILDYLPL